jgi:hypothetical protein
VPTFVDRLLGRTPVPETKAVVTGNGGTGPGVFAYQNDIPLWSASRNHRRLMKQAQELYHSDLVIHAAENKVSSRAAGLPWHLADEEGDEVTDESPPDQKAIRDWLEKPQAQLVGRKQMGRRDLWKLTHRHDGLCGTTFWYLDQRTLLTGAPLVTLYINPARMSAQEDANGTLLGWKLDADDEGHGGVPLELDEVLQFVYDPPDWGHYGIGLVEAAGRASALSRSADRHVESVLTGGGRLAGLISPKPGTIVGADDWAAAVRDWRNIGSDPESAKRLHIVRGPVDFVRTAATLHELAIVEVAKMSREDKLGLWGVPESQLPYPSAGGLNSGETKGYDEAVLMQGAVHDRVTPFREVIQFQVLDRIAANGGPTLQLVIEEPEFDDESPAYERAAKARELPLTRNQRLAIIGLDPLPDYDLEGNPLGTAIDLPIGLTVVGAGPGEDGNLKPLPEPDPVPAPLVAAPPPAVPPAEGEVPTKAKPMLLGLRKTVDTRFVASTKRDVQKALADQAQAVSKRVRARGSKTMSVGSWWDEKVEDARLRKAIEPHNLAIAETVSGRVSDLLDKPKKASSFEDVVAQYVRVKTGERILGINATTRDLIAKLIADGFSQGLGAAEVADSISVATAFDEARAELISRTEAMLAYNEAALSSYREFGVTEVEALDGDDDPECAERNGTVWPVDEAFGILDHPNGTLDWAPVIKAAPVETDVDRIKWLTEPTPPVQVFVGSSQPGTTRTVIDRDPLTGRVTGTHEEYVGAP